MKDTEAREEDEDEAGGRKEVRIKKTSNKSNEDNNKQTNRQSNLLTN